MDKTNSTARSRQGSQRKRKLAVGYEDRTPTCSACWHFKKEVIVLRDSLPKIVVPARCKKHNFNVKPEGCCDDWFRKTRGGAVLTLEITEAEAKGGV